MQDINTVLVIGAALVLVGVLVSKLSSRLGVPALLLFLGLGMLAGSEGPGGVEFADYELAQGVGIVALAFILFAGGLDTRWLDIRPVLARGAGLATVGVLVTALVSGVIASWALDLPLSTGLLLGAIISSTDAAAVFSVLRSRNVSMRGELRPLLELESGSNDPMAVFLTIGFLELVTEPTATWTAMLVLFVTQMTVGAVVGLGIGRAGVALINRLNLEYEGLYPVITLAMVPLTYGAAAALNGSGFLAVYLAGLVMAQRTFVHKRSLIRFHDAVAWLSQIGMFLVLGLLVFPSELVTIAGRSLLVAAALIFVARPLAVFLTLAPTRTSWRERTMVAWVGLRGAVPIILATFPLMEEAPGANTIFNAVFFIVFTSVLVQGTTIPTVARWLRVEEPLRTRSPWPLEPGLMSSEGEGLQEIVVHPASAAVGRSLVQLGIPAGTIIVLIRRDGSFVVPQGTTELAAGDDLLAIGPEGGLDFLRSMMGPRRDKPHRSA